MNTEIAARKKARITQLPKYDVSGSLSAETEERIRLVRIALGSRISKKPQIVRKFDL